MTEPEKCKNCEDKAECNETMLRVAIGVRMHLVAAMEARPGLFLRLALNERKNEIYEAMVNATAQFILRYEDTVGKDFDEGQAVNHTVEFIHQFIEKRVGDC